MFMAFHTRKVTIKALNDSKQIAVLVYISSISVLLMGVLAFALRNQLLAYTIGFILGLFGVGTVFLSVVFIPRVRITKIVLLRMCMYSENNRFCKVII